MLDSKDPLIALADTIKWDEFEKEGKPSKPIRLMIGLLLLKQLERECITTMEKKPLLSLLLWNE